MDAQNASSTRPYLIRALYEWCTDNGLTPYIAVRVDDTVQVPREYVKNGEIVLNISFDATSGLKVGNDFVEFHARFAGTAREIMVPVDHVIAIYARENGQGMAFPQPEPATAVPGKAPAAEPERAAAEPEVKLVSSSPAPDGGDEPPPATDPSAGGRARPTLTRIK